MALGGKYSAEMLRKGAAYGLVELVFTVEHPSQEAQLRALDIYPEEGQLESLSRKLMDGRSVSKINGETGNNTDSKRCGDDSDRHSRTA